MKDGIHPETKTEHCCGTCYWYNGEIGDGSQFCDEKETYVNDKCIACYKYREKY